MAQQKMFGMDEPKFDLMKPVKMKKGKKPKAITLPKVKKPKVKKA
jgi:hypothetical protein